MAGFESKSVGMQTFLNQMFGIQPALDAGVCTSCGSAVSEFRDETSAREYGLSGLCQPCQDVAFAPPPDEADAVYDVPPPHVEPDHFPGRLYDCPGCERGPCVCVAGEEGCVSNSCPYNDFD